MFRTVDSALESNLGWTVTDLEDLRADKAYQAMWEATTPAPNRTLAEWAAHWVPVNVLHADLHRTVAMDHRDAVMTSLGVEHLVMVRMFVSGVAPNGPRAKPQTTMRLVIYRLGEKRPVFKGLATGRPADPRVVLTGSPRNDAQMAAFTSSFRRAAQELGKKY